MKQFKQALCDSIEVVALDLDGVVYLGNKPIEGSIESVNLLREQGLKVVFVTNNSGQCREEISRKLCKMGIPTTKEEVFNSAYAACHLIFRRSIDNNINVLLLGTEGLICEAETLGLTVVTRSPCDYVIVGFDREFTYEKISIGLNALLDGAQLVACNREARFPSEDGIYLPGCGAMVASLEASWGRKAHIVVGKPFPMMLTMISEEVKIPPSKILVVGDTLDSDISMANQFGSPSVWIRGNAGSASSPDSAGISPSISLEKLADLPQIIKRNSSR